MLHDRKYIAKRLFQGILSAAILALVSYSCANIGTPDGGDYDELPPRFIRSNPQAGALNNTRTRIVLEFDEFIKLENASEKVVISPPQIQMPEIKPGGKRITVNLLDSLKPNTTYTIDFADAIVDNNEGNPLGNFAFTFSTGNVIDTMEVSGIMLDASNLEPIKGMLVGLHSNLNDSAFLSIPFDRVSRTDSRGQFTIRGIAPGSYRIYGLQDANQNFMFDQKSEMIAFSDSVIIPRFEERIRQDTVWKDTITIDTIISRNYTHFLPDHILLRAFKEEVTSQYFIKNERLTKNKFTFYFSAPADTLPTITGFNFDADNAFLIEKSLKNDTINYWIKDSLVYNLDTLKMSVSYLYTDTLGMLVPTTDTLRLATRALKGGQEKEKKKKKNDEEPEPTNFLNVNVSAPSSMDIYNNIKLEFEEPLAWYDSTGIHLEEKVDTLWQPVPFLFRQDSVNIRRFELLAGWEHEKEYKFSVDSTTFHGIYGLFTDGISQTFKVRSLDEYSSLFLNITGADSLAMVELLDSQDKPIRKVPVVNGQADFYYLNPGKYYLRLFNDKNGNGVWDTGLFEENRQPEMMYYYPQPLELKTMWEVTQDWDVNTVALDRQKPNDIKKQKPDEDKKKKRERPQRTRRR